MQGPNKVFGGKTTKSLFDEKNLELSKEADTLMTPDQSHAVLADVRVHVRFKLFSLWASVMFCYIYGDFFELFQPGKLQAMIAGRMPLGAISQGVLLAMAVVVAIPSLMLFLSLVLPSGFNRWLNIVLGAVYTVIMILAMQGGWDFYIFLALIEIILTTLITWYAWTWPKEATR